MVSEAPTSRGAAVEGTTGGHVNQTASSPGLGTAGSPPRASPEFMPSPRPPDRAPAKSHILQDLARLENLVSPALGRCTAPREPTPTTGLL